MIEREKIRKLKPQENQKRKKKSDEEERKICKQVLADEFFKSHAHDIGNFGENFAKNSHKKNVENLANSHRWVASLSFTPLFH